MSITGSLAEFVSGTGSIPQLVRERALLTILDAYATAIAGTAEPAAAVFRAALLPLAGSGRARLAGLPSVRVDPASAAAINGATAHCLDYDSISLEVSGFVAGQMACALAALVDDEEPRRSAEEVVTAFCLGWEAAAAVGRGVNTLHYSKGWHPTSTLGLLAATFACSRLRRFDAAQTATAISIAVSEASGVKTMIGNLLNPWHAGKAARNAVVACRLVEAGFQGHPGALEADQGFLNLFNGVGEWDGDRITGSLGKPWDLERPGPVFKVYPCCGLIHSGLDAVLGMNLDPAQVRGIEVRVHEFVPRVMHVGEPVDGYSAKFSIPYCVGLAATTGRVALGSFATVDPSVVEFGRRVTTTIHPDLHGGATFLEKEFTEVIVETSRGRLVKRVDRIHNRGTGDHFTEAELRSKFADCLTHGGIGEAAGGEWNRLRHADPAGPWDLWSAP